MAIIQYLLQHTLLVSDCKIQFSVLNKKEAHNKKKIIFKVKKRWGSGSQVSKEISGSKEVGQEQQSSVQNY